MHSFLREDDVSFSRALLESALAGQSAISKDLSFSDLDQLWAVMQPISFADCSLSRLSSVRQAGCAVLEVVGCWDESLHYSLLRYSTQLRAPSSLDLRHLSVEDPR